MALRSDDLTSTLTPAEQLAPPESLLNAEIRRTKAPAIEIPTGTAIIAGVVKTKEGDPLEGVEVHALPMPPAMKTSRSSSDRKVRSARRDLREVLDKAAEEWAESEGAARSAVTDAEGKFRIEGLVDLDFRVRAEAEGYSFGTREFSVVNPVEKPDAVVKIEAVELVGIQVSVVDENGVALERAIVSANGTRLEWTADDPLVYSTSQQFSVQAFSEPIPTTRGSQVARQVSESVNVDAVAEPDRVVTLTLETACIVMGTIVGEKVDSKSWQNVYAIPLRPDEPFDDTVPQSDDIESYAREDSFVFGDLMPGRYAICLIGPGNMAVDYEILDVEPGLKEITLDREVFDSSKYLTVSALSPRGTTVRSFNARLEYQKDGGEISDTWLNSSSMPDGARLLNVVDFTEFDYDAWPAGTKAWVAVTSSVYGKVRIPLSSGQREVVAQFSEPCELTVRLSGDFSMGGFVIRIKEGESDRTEPPVIATARQGRGRSGPRIDARGVAKFRALSPGPVTVTLTQSSSWWGNGRELAEEDIVLSGADHQVSLEVPTVSALEILVTPCSERRYITLTTEDEDGEEHHVGWMNTTEDGRATFRGLTPGEYEVLDQKSGAKLKATVPGPELRIDLSEHVTKLQISVNKLDGKLTEWGLVGGDLIVAVNGDPIEDSETLLDAVHSDDVTVTVERGDETLELDLSRYPRKTRDGNPLGGWISIHSD
jgi:protocatechuate 3,4-dioxygenase beta subunit